MLPGAIFSKTAVSAGRIFKNSGRKQEIPVSKKSIKRVTVAGCLSNFRVNQRPITNAVDWLLYTLSIL